MQSGSRSMFGKGVGEYKLIKEGWDQFINILTVLDQEPRFTLQEDMKVSDRGGTQLKGTFQDDGFFRSMHDG